MGGASYVPVAIRKNPLELIACALPNRDSSEKSDGPRNEGVPVGHGGGERGAGGGDETVDIIPTYHGLHTHTDSMQISVQAMHTFVPYMCVKSHISTVKLAQQPFNFFNY